MCYTYFFPEEIKDFFSFISMKKLGESEKFLHVLLCYSINITFCCDVRCNSSAIQMSVYKHVNDVKSLH